MFSSLTDEWRTPKSLFDKLDKEFKFDSDPCPSGKRRLKKGLKKRFGKRVFINPPYSEIRDWVESAFNHYRSGNLVVMLIPSRTDTRYWHDFIMRAKEIRFIKGRLKFSGYKNTAPFPSCVVVFRGPKPKKRKI